MKRNFALFGLLLVVALAGCASDPIVTATGAAALDAYKGRDISRAQAILLAKRAALIDAQRNLLEEYAGTFLTSESEVRDFVAQNDRIVSRTGGLIKGVHRVSDRLSPDQTAWIVTVRARESDIKAALKKRRRW